MITEVKLRHKNRHYRVAVRSHNVWSAGAIVLATLPMFWKREDVTIINCCGYVSNAIPVGIFNQNFDRKVKS